MGIGRKVRTRRIILSSVLLAIVALAIYATWVVITSNWVFGLATDKSSYSLGERVQITVTLENHGYIPHSITSLITNPVVVQISEVSTYNPTVTTQVWYSPYLRNETAFTVSPGQALVRTFTWNQTNTVNPWFWNTTYKPGTYLVEAFIPKDSDLTLIDSSTLFSAWFYINVTAT